jgi:uncharacterized membrane protein affecting hemolysin expression
MKDFLLKFIEQRWAIVLLFFLLLMLIAMHAVMLHWHRPDAAVNWCEGLITGTFTALIAKLKD